MQDDELSLYNDANFHNYKRRVKILYKLETVLLTALYCSSLQTGLTGACSDQDWTSLPVAHQGGHLDLIS